jgi:hypothetical protein
MWPLRQQNRLPSLLDAPTNQLYPANAGNGASTVDNKEIALLKDFYSGTRARALRNEYGLEPWEVVSRYRNLPRAEFEAVRQAIGA